MKPRIVREQIVAGKHTDFYGPAGRSECVGKAALVLYWPLKCPYTPNDVMAACERHGWTLTGVPEPRQDLWAVRLQGHEPCSALLTPEFMGEPERCEHPSTVAITCCTQFHRYCPACGATISDRRESRRTDRRGAK